MQVSVTSEIGRLRSVMIHPPGDEVERMVPSMMGELLFDDILFGERAREEHRRLTAVLALVADEVLSFHSMLTEVLGEQACRDSLLAKLGRPLPEQALGMLREASAVEMASMLVGGIVRPGVRKMPDRAGDLFLLAPLPNLLFHRDPAAIVGRGAALVSAMATEARRRESLLLHHVLAFHPRFSGLNVVLSAFDEAGHAGSPARMRACIEGGDVLVAREDMLLIGVSARTNRRAVELFAAHLKERHPVVQTVLVVELPQQRSCMHLDTVFTFISENECLVHEPVILEGEVQQAAVYELDLSRKELSYAVRPSLLAALASKGMDIEPIACGGPDDPIAQQREQWTDGANAFCLAPGVILLYRRNGKTVEELVRRGYQAVNEDDLLSGKEQVDLTGGRKVAVLLRGYELSRARGGPRCLTMPIWRD